MIPRAIVCHGSGHSTPPSFRTIPTQPIRAYTWPELSSTDASALNAYTGHVRLAPSNAKILAILSTNAEIMVN